MDGIFMKSLIMGMSNCISTLKLNEKLKSLGNCKIVDCTDVLIGLAVCEYQSLEPYDLICLSNNIKNIEAINVLKRIRLFEDSYGIPYGKGCRVIIYSSKYNGTEILNSFRAGCDAYFIAPFSIKILTDFIEENNLINDKLGV